MEPIIKLKQTLIAMVDVHEQLLDLAYQKRTILVEGKTTELQMITSKETKCTELISQLEDERKQAVKGFLAQKGFILDSITMDQVLNMLDDSEDKQFLSTMTGRLKNVVEKLKYINQNNQELIKMSLSYIQYSINLFMPKEPSVGYGMKQPAHSAKLLDAKI